MTTDAQHVITVTPETLGDEPAPPDVGWRWLKQPEAADGTWYRPTCSCGWRSKSVYTTEDRARRAGVIHIAVNTPTDPSSERYLAQLEADIPTQTWSIHLWCRQHHDQPLTTVLCASRRRRPVWL